MIKNIFETATVNELTERLHLIKADTTPLWGKMDAAQMMAHCCVSYEMIYDDIHPKPGLLKKWLLRAFIKPIVTGETTYPKNSRTAQEFIINSHKNFEAERNRLLAYINRAQKNGSDFFEGKNSHSFGPLTALEWNNMLYKHLDHHLQQFGA